MAQMYALGSNGCGQLGIGHTEDVAIPRLCIFAPPEKRHDERHATGGSGCPHIRKISAGGNHTLALSTDGNLYAAGRNDDGRCGLPLQPGKEEDLRVIFEEVHIGKISGMMTGKGLPEPNNRVSDIAATWEASFVVLDSKYVVACGSGGKGELGLGRNITSMATWTKVLDLSSTEEHILKIAASMSHVVVLLSGGQVLGWGSCRKGQLGASAKEEKTSWFPTRVETEPAFKATDVLVGRDFTLLLAARRKPELLGESKFLSGEDLEVFGKDDVAVCGWNTIHVLSKPPGSSTKTTRSLGKNDRGQFAPKTLPDIREIAAGSEHCVAVTMDNRAISWGWGEHGNCGDKVDSKGNVIDRYNVIETPQPHISFKVSAVAAGCATSFIILKEFDEESKAP
ncbi:hypothetical protein PV10_07013 [Exophiala mesophila]|uniref:RCC1-like domain-containing protein n=1 Tax=Exophiala mesophila TaxID=212818 RepID=A0A0D1Z4C9_EXOME|nr:uncharacterized protein PV10_07013 [Exophiala mesophila]KIV89627.1 hypothetical protein PV10_07013 [Exophiala mesophila]